MKLDCGAVRFFPNLQDKAKRQGIAVERYRGVFAAVSITTPRISPVATGICPGPPGGGPPGFCECAGRAAAEISRPSTTRVRFIGELSEDFDGNARGYLTRVVPAIRRRLTAGFDRICKG